MLNASDFVDNRLTTEQGDVVVVTASPDDAFESLSGSEMRWQLGWSSVVSTSGILATSRSLGSSCAWHKAGFLQHGVKTTSSAR